MLALRGSGKSWRTVYGRRREDVYPSGVGLRWRLGTPHDDEWAPETILAGESA
jgi:hypothetical protein